MAPTSLKHYRIARPLGQGGMGEVYLAEDAKLGRTGESLRRIPTPHDRRLRPGPVA